MPAFNLAQTPLSQYSETVPDDEVPPEGTYISREVLLTAVNEWVVPKGFAFINGRYSQLTSDR
jgi:hypothetical protein